MGDVIRFLARLVNCRQARGGGGSLRGPTVINLRPHDPGYGQAQRKAPVYGYEAVPGPTVYGPPGRGPTGAPARHAFGDTHAVPRGMPPAPDITPRRTRLPERVTSVRWQRRHPVLAGMVLTVAILLVVQGGLAAWVYVTVNGDIRSTRFMDLDRAWARDPQSPDAEAARQQLAYQLRRAPTKAEVRQLQAALSNLAYEWVDLDSVSPNALKAIVSREDAQLVVRRWMPFDVSANYERAKHWINGSGKDSNPSGSTIPQQLAKNLFTDGERSALRKVWEADLALMMSLTSDERRILEAYVNIVEFGPGVYGVCAASWYYFDKPPIKLSVREGATLVGLMPSPKFNTIYPTHGNVQFARDVAEQRVKGLNVFPSDRRKELFEPRNPRGSSDCRHRPESVDRRVAATQKYTDDQSYWARMTRQYVDGELSKNALSTLSPAKKRMLKHRAQDLPRQKRR